MTKPGLKKKRPNVERNITKQRLDQVLTGSISGLNQNQTTRKQSLNQS